MRKMDVNEQMIIYVIYNGEGKWLISDKEIWYFDYKKKIQDKKRFKRAISGIYYTNKGRMDWCKKERFVVHW